MSELSYAPMQMADGQIAYLDCIAIGRVWRRPGADDWTVGYGGNQTRVSGFPCIVSAKVALCRLLATEPPWPR